MNTADFLIEIQCEELPSKVLEDLGGCLGGSIWQQLCLHHLQFMGTHTCFATPRRLAVLLTGLSITQEDQIIQKRGPAVNQAYDSDGNPSKACLGFLKSCNADVKDLKILKTDQGEWVYCEQRIPGKATRDLISDIVINAIKALPVPKWMRWGTHPESFSRPVHHIVLMCNDEVIDATILGLKTGNVTVGHRFLCKEPIKITHAKDYETILEKTGIVVANFDKRKTKIYRQIKALAQQENLNLLITDEEAYRDSLLNEVTALVEWPTAFIAQFDKRFLELPSEALISAMKDHQKSFPLLDKTGNLTNKFIFISNITPNDPSIMIKGNEKVMTARLSDTEFFYKTDLKTKLIDRVEQLKTVTFQKQLGSLHDKALRLAELCDFTSNHHPNAKRTGLLAKTDLLTNMVCEFTELQGIMGYHYAKQNGESEEIAIALREQYLPRFANDNVAITHLGIALSIADKLDNLVGFFGIGLVPTGTKDPFALRRAAIGIIRTIIENKLSLNLKTLIEFSIQKFQVNLPNKNLALELLQFFNDRLRTWLKEQGFDFDVIDSVLSLNLMDFDNAYLRIKAVNNFKKLPEAESLAAANKRVANILQKNTDPLPNDADTKLFEKQEEHELYQAISSEEKKTEQQPNVILQELAKLKPLIDRFFDNVMVNAEDKAIRLNRLALLNRLRELFLKVADIAYLQKI